MSLTLDLPPFLEADIRAHAAAVGREPDAMALDLLRKHFKVGAARDDAAAAGPQALDPALDPNVPASQLDTQQWNDRFSRLLDVFAKNAPNPPMGDKLDVSRDAIYRDPEEAPP